MTQTRRKEHPVSFRMPDEDVALIDRAAALRGASRTEFVRDAAVREAESVLVERQLVKMTPAAFRHLFATLAAPGRPVKELVRVLKRRAPWEPSSGET